ncbi:hypothetical protein AADG42_12000 [Ammonicoccus fulvus]|uniref:Uncharacterized protein n=1 Tax=Ammonicoccus fulvus TaxID=3138240 RepID=A0ABZ3FPL9_9ACTN
MYDMYPKEWTEQSDRRDPGAAPRRRRRMPQSLQQPEVPTRAEV